MYIKIKHHLPLIDEILVVDISPEGDFGFQHGIDGITARWFLQGIRFGALPKEASLEESKSEVRLGRTRQSRVGSGRLPPSAYYPFSRKEWTSTIPY